MPKSIVLLGNLLGAGRPVETDFLLTFYKSTLRVQKYEYTHSPTCRRVDMSNCFNRYPRVEMKPSEDFFGAPLAGIFTR